MALCLYKHQCVGVREAQGCSCEWMNALKVSMNSMAGRGTGGRSEENLYC